MMPSAGTLLSTMSDMNFSNFLWYLNFLVLKLEYTGRITSLPGLLMPWLLALPRLKLDSHVIECVEQLGPSITAGGISTTCAISPLRNNGKRKYTFYLSKNNFSLTRVSDFEQVSVSSHTVALGELSTLQGPSTQCPYNDILLTHLPDRPRSVLFHSGPLMAMTRSGL